MSDVVDRKEEALVLAVESAVVDIVAAVHHEVGMLLVGVIRDRAIWRCLPNELSPNATKRVRWTARLPRREKPSASGLAVARTR